jgi:hypothetical protein
LGESKCVDGDFGGGGEWQRLVVGKKLLERGLEKVDREGVES